MRAILICAAMGISAIGGLVSASESEQPPLPMASPVTSPVPSPIASPQPLGTPNTQVYAGPHAEFLKALKPLPEFKIKGRPPLLGPEEVESGPLLVSLEDIGGVSVLSPDGKVRVARAGDALEFGDSFQTGEKGSARLAFEKGVQVLCPPGVILRLDQESIAGPSGGIDVPMVEVVQGEVRLLVESAPAASGDAAEPTVSRPLKLVVRTKATVMGVRGTDFLVSVTDDHTILRMVSGTVEAAPDSRALGLGHSVKAAPLESAEFVQGRPLPTPEHYEAAAELREFHDRHPPLEGMWNAAVRDAKSQRLRPQFLAIRTQKSDLINLRNGYPPAAVRAQAQELDEREKKRKLLEQGKPQEDKNSPAQSKRRRRGRRKKVEPVKPPAGEAAEKKEDE